MIFAFAVISGSSALFNPCEAGRVEDDAYFHFVFGGDFGLNYTNRDPRFQFGFDTGNQYLSIPLTFSYGQDTWIIGAKPRVQYLMSPIANNPNFRVGPGLGPVLNYWNSSAGSATVHTIEIGAQISGQVQYVLNDQFNLAVSPSIDLNFWRHASVSGGGFSGASASETKLRPVLNVVFGVGLVF